MSNTILIGTRDSQLALWQTNWVKDHLESEYPSRRFDTLSLKTTGDNILHLPLSDIGDKGLFTKELDIALLQRKIDLAVHSLKDLPTELPVGLTIGAITKRWDERDALISRAGKKLSELPRGAVIATGSLRRKAQLMHHRPDLKIVDIRGNLNTRFRKFDEANWDAMILAVAGVERLGLGKRITEKISPDILLPAVGQGSFAVVCRKDDPETLALIRSVNHSDSESAAFVERAFLRTLEGGCHVPIGARTQILPGMLILSGCVGSLDGQKLIRDAITADFSEKSTRKSLENIGIALANKLLNQGAREVLDEINQMENPPK